MTTKPARHLRVCGWGWRSGKEKNQGQVLRFKVNRGSGTIERL